MPSNLDACCTGFIDMVRDHCECNPAIDLLLGVGGDKVYQLEPICRFRQPHKWVSIPLSNLRNCDLIKTHHYGCKESDVQIDAKRLENIFKFIHLFDTAANESSCLDTPRFVQRLGTVFDEEIEVNVPYGIGIYRGYEDVAEYLGIAFSSLNHGFWQ